MGYPTVVEWAYTTQPISYIVFHIDRLSFDFICFGQTFRPESDLSSDVYHKIAQTF